MGALEILLGPAPVRTRDLKSSPATVHLYPNPAKEVLYISSDESINCVEVYDLMGRKVKEIGKPRTTPVDDRYLLPLSLSGLSGAAYFVKVETTLGEVTKQIIVN